MPPLETEYIYLDHNATTPLESRVVEAMVPFMEREYGNPSSPYPLGVVAKESLEKFRAEVASLIGCQAKEIIFTSGGSESNNTVLKGMVDVRRPADFHIITSAVEHPAVLNPCFFLMELGVEVTVLPVDRYGMVDPQDVRRAITPKTALVSIMMANNETGTIQPIRDIALVTREAGIPLHTDAAQAVGKIPVDVRDLGVDFLTLAGHKLYAPKGVGVLFVREGLDFTPLIHGGGQEWGKRAGTENVILAAGLAAAAGIARGRLKDDMQNARFLRDHLQGLLFDALEGIVLNGHPVKRLPNTLNISIPGIEGARILEGIPRLYASTGAACHDRNVKLSHVLSAMGLSPEVGMGTLRLSLGRSNTIDQIEDAASMIIHRVKGMKRS
ncbi:MAG: cysteine desulfurase [Deltaproteobacteria bacterium]|nr:cysteine desulfurase [Deltaproteobacteria bacterium]